MDATLNSKKIRQGIKSADLALSEERLGNTDTAEQAARTAGRLFARAGATLEDLWKCLAEYGIGEHQFCWNHMVDGWYDAA